MKIDSVATAKCVADDYHREVVAGITHTRRVRIVFFGLLAASILVVDSSILTDIRFTSDYYEGHDFSLFLLILCILEIGLSSWVLSAKSNVILAQTRFANLKGRKARQTFDFWLRMLENEQDRTARRSAFRFALAAVLLFSVAFKLIVNYKQGNLLWTIEDYAYISTVMFIVSYSVGDFLRTRHIPRQYCEQYSNTGWQFKIWVLKELELSHFNPDNNA